MIVPLFGTGLRSKSAVVTAQRRLNVYYEIVPDEDKTRVAIYGTPGLAASLEASGVVRGAETKDAWTYYVAANKLYRVMAGVSAAELGTLNTDTGRVSIAFDDDVIMVVDGVNGYTYTESTGSFAQIADGDFPNGCHTCTWLGGYFVVDNGDQFNISEDGTTWDALDFATAESEPDGIRRVYANGTILVIFGALTTEFWVLSAGDFPFSPVLGSTLQLGIFGQGRFCVARTPQGIAFLARLPSGQAQAVLIQGYQFTPISTADIDTIINEYDTFTDATGYVDRCQGHDFYHLNFQEVGKSWIYDLTSGLWSERSSGADGGRHRGEVFMRIGNVSCVSDYENGNIYEIDPDIYTDNGDVIVREIVGKHFFQDLNRVIVDQIQLDMETGVGLQEGQGSDPQIMLQISKDGGRTFGNELWTTLGAVGEYLTRVLWRRLGIGRDWVFKIRMTDPVKFVITNAFMRARKAA